jgi:hypothetical protein
MELEEVFWADICVGDIVTGGDWYRDSDQDVVWGTVSWINLDDNEIWISVGESSRDASYDLYDPDDSENPSDDYKWYIQKRELVKSGFAKWLTK